MGYYDGLNGDLCTAVVDGIEELEAWIKENPTVVAHDKISEIAEDATPCMTGEILRYAYESHGGLDLGAALEDHDGNNVIDILATKISREIADRLGRWYQDHGDDFEECVECGKGFEDDDLFYDDDDYGPVCQPCLDGLAAAFAWD